MIYKEMNCATNITIMIFININYLIMKHVWIFIGLIIRNRTRKLEQEYN